MCNKRILCKFKDEDAEKSNITKEKQRKILLNIKKKIFKEKNKKI